MKLIFNADDLGFSKGINFGIFEAFKEGVVTSTTIMMNMAYANHAIDLFKDEKIGMGVHLNITSGKPLLNSHKHIVNSMGTFRKDLTFSNEQLIEIEQEFVAQIQLAIDKGVCVSHLDSHHHIHMWNEAMFGLTKKLSNKYGICIRCNRDYAHMNKELQSGVESTACFSEDFFDQTVSIQTLKDVMMKYKDAKSLEIMVHPGFLCGGLINVDSYREKRLEEYSILTSDQLKSFIEIQGFKLVNFHQIK